MTNFDDTAWGRGFVLGNFISAMLLMFWGMFFTRHPIALAFLDHVHGISDQLTFAMAASFFATYACGSLGLVGCILVRKKSSWILWLAHIIFSLIGWMLISFAGSVIFDSYLESVRFFLIHGLPAAFSQTFLVALIKWHQSRS